MIDIETILADIEAPTLRPDQFAAPGQAAPALCPDVFAPVHRLYRLIDSDGLMATIIQRRINGQWEAENRRTGETRVGFATKEEAARWAAPMFGRKGTRTMSTSPSTFADGDRYVFANRKGSITLVVGPSGEMTVIESTRPDVEVGTTYPNVARAYKGVSGRFEKPENQKWTRQGDLAEPAPEPESNLVESTAYGVDEETLKGWAGKKSRRRAKKAEAAA